MNLEDALKEAILATLPFGRFLSAADVIKCVAPRRERQVGDTLNTPAMSGVLDTNPPGGGWPILYGRRATERRI